ncbi:MAG: hypothetical protein UT63_C0056G0006 [Candidatus Gottesmanbacteria bacterium GW2011_GWC2_39_8]|uniref:Uncharacterized protein n=1 Tax=Candidatus Gottesmanbacteria bacterium GW2011_GWC2_39_8 TaxID=1618450 RepID=A0A0G0T266_9BACT|nr:MAG: hypothetical protein UT63_C0056G0006 [Candidatus Gottesmanbacteria bacterium GW2011_GWC2_39_8]
MSTKESVDKVKIMPCFYRVSKGTLLSLGSNNTNTLTLVRQGGGDGCRLLAVMRNTEGQPIIKGSITGYGRCEFDRSNAAGLRRKLMTLAGKEEPKTYRTCELYRYMGDGRGK